MAIMYDNGSAAAGGVGLLVALIAILVYCAILLGSYVLFGWMLSRIFRKAGIQPWKAWVPIYNNWVLLEMGGQPGWWSVLAFVPFANFVAVVFLCIAIYHLDAGFGKPGAGWLLLFLFLPVVWIIILAFDGSRWEPSRMEVSPLYGPNVPWPGGEASHPYAAG